MNRCAASVGIAFFLIVGCVLADDPAANQPPALLKKKAKSQPPVPEQKQQTPSPKEQPPKEETKDQMPQEGEDIEQRLQEIISRLSRNFRTAEERLEHKDASERTQEVQRDIIKDLDELIEQTRRQQQQQQDQQQQENQQSSNSQSSRDHKKQQARGKSMQKGMTGPSRQGRGQQSQQRKEAGSRAEMSKIADLYKNIWGHLPETLRQEMDQYAREQFMDKYKDLLKQYYATIAEKSRREQ